MALKTSVGQVAFELLIKTLFAYFLSQLALRISHHFQKKVLTILRMCTEHAQFWFLKQFPFRLPNKL